MKRSSVTTVSRYVKKPRRSAAVLTTRSVETKETTSFYSTQLTASSSINVNLLNAIESAAGEGVSTDQRVGNKIRIKSIEVIGTFGTATNNNVQTATFFMAKPRTTGLVSTNFQGPFLRHDDGTTYGMFINDSAGGGNVFRFTKRFPGLGKEQRFDKDTGNAVGDIPYLRLTTGTTATVGMTFWYRIIFYDV